MPGGRPSRLTAEVIEGFTRLLPTCLYLETAAAMLGVHRTLVWQWVRRGKAEATRLARRPSARPRDKEAIYVEFYYAHEKGLASAETKALGIIARAAEDRIGVRTTAGKDKDDKDVRVDTDVLLRKGEWQAAAWMAERRWPEKYALRDRREMRDMQRQLKELKDAIAPRSQAAAAAAQA
jgi:hypothetical protein